MILSGRDLSLYISTSKLKVSPLQDEQYQQNGLDLYLDKVECQTINYQDSKHIGHFWLGCTRETLELPDDLMAFVELRSTWARRGFFLPPTIVDAGFKGNLTLEILAMGGWDPRMALNKRFAHLIFAKTTGPCIPYEGVYKDQTGITKPPSDH